MLGLNVDGRNSAVLSGLRKPNQDNNFYVLVGSGINDEVLLTSSDTNFKDNFMTNKLLNTCIALE